MQSLGLGITRTHAGSKKSRYFQGLPSFVKDKYSLAFNAQQAETLQDYDTNVLYFRDANFGRVAATFSRTSDATRVNKQGLIETVASGVPRIDYSDGSANLLMEPSRTNNVLQSAYPRSGWDGFFTNMTVTTSSEIAAPDGSLNTAKVIGNGYLGIVKNVTSGTTYTFSFYIYITGSPNQWQITSQGAGGSFSKQVLSQLILNEWVRVSITITATGTGTQQFRFFSDGSNCAGHIWGAQLEAGSYPTSYIPTAGSSVTRSADTANIANAVSSFDETYAYVSGNTAGGSLGLWFRNPISGSSGWGLRGTQVYERIGSITFKSVNPTTEYGKIVIRAINNGEFSYWYNGNSKEIVTTNIGDLDAYAGTTILLNQDSYSGVTFHYGFYDQVLIFENTALNDDECRDLTLTDYYTSFESMAQDLGYEIP